MTGDVKRMYINGEWILAEGGATFDIVNPADQSVVATVTNGAAPEIQRAVAAAHAAFREWSRSEEHTSELQSRPHLVCRLLLGKKKPSAPRKELHTHHSVADAP